MSMIEPSYPTAIKDVVTKLTANVQKSLQSKLSRISIELPSNVEFGVEGMQVQTAKKVDTAAKSNRQAAYLITQMFKMLSTTTTVVFSTENEAKLAKDQWKSTFDGNIISCDVKKQKLKTAGRKLSAMDRDLLTISDLLENYNTEVLILVAPKVKYFTQIMELHNQLGMGTLIILLNGRYGNENAYDQAIIEGKRLEAIYENVFCYSVPKIGDDINQDYLLYHEYQGSWYLAKKTVDPKDGKDSSNSNPLSGFVQILQRVVSKPIQTIWTGNQRPTQDDIKSIVSSVSSL
jgi:hypothetical protein